MQTGAVLIGFALFYLIFNVPMLRGVFEVARVPLGYSIFAVGMAFVSLCIVQAVRITEAMYLWKKGRQQLNMKYYISLRFPRYSCLVSWWGK